MSFLFCSQRKYFDDKGKLLTKGNIGAETGQNFRVFSPRYSLIGRKSDYDDGNIVDGAHEYLLVNFSFFKPLTNIKYFFLLIKLLKKNDKIIIRAGGLGDFVAFICPLIGKRYGLEIGGCVFNSMWYHGNVIGKIIAPFSYILRLYLIFMADRVQCVSSSFIQKKYFINYLCSKNVGISNVRIKTDEFRIIPKSFNLVNHQNINISYIGSFNSSFKGHVDAINFIKYAKDKGYNLNLNLIGVGDFSYLKKYSDKLCLSSNVNFFNPLPSNEIISWLRNNSDIYIQFSKREGISRALIEAMSQSIPVLATNIGATFEVVPKSQLISLTNFDDILSKINLIFNSVESYELYSNISYKNSLRYNSENLKVKFESFWRNYFGN